MRRFARAWAIAVAGLVAVAAAAVAQPAGARAAPTGTTALIVVDVPLHYSPVAQTIVNGAKLAAGQINADGGVSVDHRAVQLRVRAVDSQLSPITTRDNVDAAIADGAVAVVDEGTGVDAAWQAASDAGLPIGIVYQGAASLVDAKARPNVFRIAPTDHGVAFRLAEYVVPMHARVALITDDSVYGTGGQSALHDAFATIPNAVVADLQVPAGTDPAPEVIEARDSGASAIVVWAEAPTVAAVVRAVRQSGWTVPIYSAPSAEDPLVRQQLADHPDWLDGLTFALSRLTSERGPGPFEQFDAAYTQRFGADLVGVKSQGRNVIQAPDYAMYSYDFVKVVAAAMQRSGSSRESASLLKAMDRVEITGANGDERSFNELSHEGVVDDDIFFAVFHDMVWTPVKNDALSATLPPIKQTN